MTRPCLCGLRRPWRLFGFTAREAVGGAPSSGTVSVDRGGNGLPPTFTRPVLLAGVCMIQGGRCGFWSTLAPGGGEGRVRGRGGKLIQEAQVVLEEEPDVVDPVLEHGDALDTHAEGPARDLLGVIAHVAEHVGMYHARAQNLEPAGLAADATAGAGAREA